MNEMYNRIQDLAREKGMSIRSLCLRSDVYPTRLTDLKNGRVKTLSDDTLRKLANTLGATPELLLYGENNARILHVDLDQKKPDFKLLCSSLNTDELVDLIYIASLQIKRKRALENSRKPE